ncbi:MAG: TetR/AcrR family transcriptional regulator [Leptospiraceae bacterium]|nr:TetR/AcrR family transcriptional regulator [Leptospiraceae bacterium]
MVSNEIKSKVQSRKEREFIKRGEEILETAKSLFKKQNPALVSMDMIANEVGIGRGTLYLHYKGKDELMMRIVLNRHIELLRELDNIDLKLSAEDLARKTVRVYLEHNINSPEDYLMQKKCEENIIKENVGEEILKEVEEERLKRMAIMEKIFLRLKEEGKIRDIPPYLLAGATWGMLKGALDVIVSGYFRQEIADEEMFFALVENLLFYGLFKSEEKLK